MSHVVLQSNYPGLVESNFLPPGSPPYRFHDLPPPTPPTIESTQVFCNKPMMIDNVYYENTKLVTLISELIQRMSIFPGQHPDMQILYQHVNSLIIEYSHLCEGYRKLFDEKSIVEDLYFKLRNEPPKVVPEPVEMPPVVVEKVFQTPPVVVDNFQDIKRLESEIAFLNDELSKQRALNRDIDIFRQKQLLQMESNMLAPPLVVPDPVPTAHLADMEGALSKYRGEILELHSKLKIIKSKYHKEKV